MRRSFCAAMVVNLLIAVHSFAAGIPWETSLTEAQAKARQQGKPILLLHLFGRLDQEFT
ncbi:MAG TPA: hypothetical protein VLH08_06285 [Acidobacteriota bacterium]|nr:hypothetical protein [Acidobacteriota bacterium]